MSEFSMLYEVLMLIMMFIVTSVEVYVLSKIKNKDKTEQQVRTQQPFIPPPPMPPPPIQQACYSAESIAIPSSTPYAGSNLTNYSSFQK